MRKEVKFSKNVECLGINFSHGTSRIFMAVNGKIDVNQQRTQEEKKAHFVQFLEILFSKRSS